MQTTNAISGANTMKQAEPRALRILAKSVFRELKTTGYSRSDIVSFATELLSLVSSDIRGQADAAE